MIPPSSAGLVMFGRPQDVPAGPGVSQAADGFYVMFEQALGIGGSAQVIDETAAEVPIDMSDAQIAERNRAVRQRSSELDDRTGAEEGNMNSASAVLVAALSPTVQGPSQALSPGPHRVVDLPASAMAAAPSVVTPSWGGSLPQPPSAQGAGPMSELSGIPVADLFTVTQSSDVKTVDLRLPVSMPQRKANLPLQTLSARNIGAMLESLGDLGVAAQPADSPASVAGGLKPLSPSPQVSPPAVSQEPESPVMGWRPLLGPQGSHIMPTAADESTTRLALPADIDPPGAEQRSSDPLVTRFAHLFATSVREVQSDIRRSDSGQTIEQVPDLLPTVALAEEPANAAGAASEEIPVYSLPQGSAAQTSTSSGSLQPIEPEVFEGEGFQAQSRAGQVERDPATMRQGWPRIETSQDTQQNGSFSDSEGGRHSLDSSSPPPDDGRQLGSDLVLATPPRGEELRSGSLAPSGHPRALVDQVVDQVTTAARLSLRREGEQVQLRLHPHMLGELVIEVSWKDSGIVAAIKAVSPDAGELLANDLSRLRNALGEQGIPVSALGVQVGLDFRQWSFEGNGTRALPIGHLTEAIPRRVRESSLSIAATMETDSLIDIRV